jgi:NAD(P)-dependent dehydrogenase (short-subunit alcohol dehydrogenase family)
VFLQVNAIAPGPIHTPLVTSTFSESNIEDVNSPPMGRPGQPIECATVCVFLYVSLNFVFASFNIVMGASASRDASYITGQTIHVDGGMFVSS